MGVTAQKGIERKDIVLYNKGRLLYYNFHIVKGVLSKMADIIKRATAGTMESSDAYVEISPAEGLEISLESVVQKQFGSAIEAVISDVLAECKVANAKVTVIDKGALDCVIRARVETAVMRGRGE